VTCRWSVAHQVGLLAGIDLVLSDRSLAPLLADHHRAHANVHIYARPLIVVQKAQVNRSGQWGCWGFHLSVTQRPVPFVIDVKGLAGHEKPGVLLVGDPVLDVVCQVGNPKGGQPLHGYRGHQQRAGGIKFGKPVGKLGPGLKLANGFFAWASALAMKADQPAREHYAYSKHDSCSVLAAIEPLTGQRLAHIRRRRTKYEFALFIDHLAQTYPDAEKIVLVLDNLNTHSASAFYEHFPAYKAAELTSRFEFVYTPKCASWLNMIEIEFSALSRQCLNQRIGSINKLGKEVMRYFKERMDNRITLCWQFSCQQSA